MAKRWSAEDIRDLKTLAQEYLVQVIAEKMDRTVGGVAFKAHQLGLPVKARSRATDPESRDFSWTQRATTGPLRQTNTADGCGRRDEVQSRCCLRCGPSRCDRHPAHGRRRCPR